MKALATASQVFAAGGIFWDVATAATTQPEYVTDGDSASFYYFLVGADSRPHYPAVLTTQNAERHVGEVVVLEDGSRVRVLAIELSDDENAKRGLDGVLVVEAHAIA